MPTPFFTGYLAQGVGSPGAFVESTVAGYARQPVSFTTLTPSGSTSLYTPINIQNGSTTVTLTQRALYDAPTGGSLIMWWNLGMPKAIPAYGMDMLRPSMVSHTFPALALNGQGINAVDTPAGTAIGVTAEGNHIFAGAAVEVENGVIYAATFSSSNSVGTVYTMQRLTAGQTLSALNAYNSIRQTATGSYVLPTHPADATFENFKDALGNFATYNATVTAGSGDTIDGAATYLMNINRQAIGAVYDATNRNWDIV